MGEKVGNEKAYTALSWLGYPTSSTFLLVQGKSQAYYFEHAQEGWLIAYPMWRHTWRTWMRLSTALGSTCITSWTADPLVRGSS